MIVSKTTPYNMLLIGSVCDSSAVSCHITKFPDGEWHVCFERKNFDPNLPSLIVHNHYQCDILAFTLLLDAVKRVTYNKICAVIPYLPYSRQDRMTSPGYPISAKVIANLMSSYIDMLATVDLHAPQIEAFYDIPVLNLSPATIFATHISKQYANSIGDVVIVAPDAGALARSQAVAKELCLPLAIANKQREKNGPRFGEIKAINVFGDVVGKQCIIIDDLIAGGGTIVGVAELLKSCGAAYVSAYVTHGMFSADPAVAIKNIENSALDKLVIGDTCRPIGSINNAKIEIIDVVQKCIGSVVLSYCNIKRNT